jgi:hypothetical protein
LNSKCRHCGDACGDAISLELYKGEAIPYYIMFCSVEHLIKWTCHKTQKSWRDTVDPTRTQKKNPEEEAEAEEAAAEEVKDTKKKKKETKKTKKTKK